MRRLAAGAAGLALLAGPALASTAVPAPIGRWTAPGGGRVVFGSCPEQTTEPLICGHRAGGRELAHGLRETAPGVWTGRGGAVARERGPDRLDFRGRTWRRAEGSKGAGS